MRAFLLAAFLLVGVQLAPAGRGEALAASNARVQVVNLSDHDFWVAWFTDSPVTGSIRFGTSCAVTDQTSPEQPGRGYVHLADARSSGTLNSDTTYYYKIVDNASVDDNGGQCYTATTFHQLASPAVPNTVYGFVTTPTACSSPTPGALVTLTVTHAGATSLPLAAMTSSTGGWTIVVGSASDASGTPLTAVDGDAISVTAAASASQTQTEAATYRPPASAPQRLPDLCLVGTAAPSATATPPVTPSSAPTSATPTSTTAPTPAATLDTRIPTPTTPPTATAPETVPDSTPTAPAPAVQATAAPTSTRTPDSTHAGGGPATGTPNTFWTPMPAPTATTGVSGTPFVTTERTPTVLPTAASPATVAPILTASPGPSSMPAPRVTQTARIAIRASLTKAWVHPGEKEQMVVYTVSRAHVGIVVSYPHHGGVFHSSFRADKHGLWRRTWVVRTHHTGVAVVLLTVVRGHDSRHFHRSFVIR